METKIRYELKNLDESNKINDTIYYLQEINRKYLEGSDLLLQNKQRKEMETKIKSKSDKLVKDDKIEMNNIIDSLKEINKKYIEDRNFLLQNNKIKEAKAVHNELANIYLYVADKITDEAVKESLKNFAFYWLRNGETETFIEPAKEPTLKHKFTGSIENKKEKKSIILTYKNLGFQEIKIIPSVIVNEPSKIY